MIKFITVRIDEKLKKIAKRKKARDKRAARRPRSGADGCPRFQRQRLRQCQRFRLSRAAVTPATVAPGMRRPAAPPVAAAESTRRRSSYGGTTEADRPISGSQRPTGGDKAIAGKKQYFRRKKMCRFCVDKIDDINYKDVRMLNSFMSERGKITPRRISGVCAPHQRRLAEAIKQARNIALMPFSTSM